MRAVIVTGGSMSDTELIRKYLAEDSILIACDSGLNYVFAEGLVPDIILGDFDSVNREILSFYKAKGCEAVTYPVKKDNTDTELGIFEAEKRGADDIVLLGASGTRLDHTIANIQLLVPLGEKGIRARLADEHNIIEPITSKHTLRLDAPTGSYVSLLPLTQRVCGVTAYGLEYPLDNVDIAMGSSLTVSNVITSEGAWVSVAEGVLISVIAKD
jgi:thiamine pyrophosphokinase